MLSKKPKRGTNLSLHFLGNQEHDPIEEKMIPRKTGLPPIYLPFPTPDFSHLFIIAIPTQFLPFKTQYSTPLEVGTIFVLFNIVSLSCS